MQLKVHHAANVRDAEGTEVDGSAAFDGGCFSSLTHGALSLFSIDVASNLPVSLPLYLSPSVFPHTAVGTSIL